jgi:hypothetical protein
MTFNTPRKTHLLFISLYIRAYINSLFEVESLIHKCNNLHCKVVTGYSPGLDGDVGGREGEANVNASPAPALWREYEPDSCMGGWEEKQNGSLN